MNKIQIVKSKTQFEFEYVCKKKYQTHDSSYVTAPFTLNSYVDGNKILVHTTLSSSQIEEKIAHRILLIGVF